MKGICCRENILYSRWSKMKDDHITSESTFHDKKPVNK